MKAFVAYRFSGEDPAQLDRLLLAVTSALRGKGVEPYCTFFDEPSFRNKALGAKQIMAHAFSVIDDSDFLFVLQTSNERSEGMLMEVGYCLADRKPIMVATKVGVENTYLPQMATVAFEGTDIHDLYRQIQQIRLVTV